MLERRSSSLLLVAMVAACGAPAGGDAGPADAGSPPDAAADAARPPDAGPTCEAEADDFPTPREGACVSAIVDDGATLPVGDDGAGGYIVPGARRLTVVGESVPLSGFPMRAVPVPGTSFVIVTDGGVADEYLSVVDVDTLEVVDQQRFIASDMSAEALFLGLAVSSDGTRVWASGGGSGVVFGLDLDPATGQLSEAVELTVASRMRRGEGYVSGLRLLSDDRTIVANILFDEAIVVLDTETEEELARIPVPDNSYPYDVVVTPDESMAFVSLWSAFAVVAIDLSRREIVAQIEVGKNPEGLALSPDGATLVVANSDSDSLSLIDVGRLEVVDTVWIVGESAPRGSSPAAGAFGPDGRLYVVNAGDNAVDVLDVEAGFERVGRVPTMWYPTDVVPWPDGRLVILNGKHRGTGALDRPEAEDITDLIGGSVQVVAAEALTDPELARWQTEIAVSNARAAGFQEVRCPDGADYDFPIPRPGEGPSPVIEHVVLVVRENKTYDAYLGNLVDDAGEPHGDGDPSLTLLPPDEMDVVLPNTHELARRFAISDNYYSLAEQSLQGHMWTAFGRTTDFVERSWHSAWGRGYWGVPAQAVGDPISYPEEGGVFDFLERHSISAHNYGELAGSRAQNLELGYPGLVYNLGVPDIEKVTWVEQEWVVRCNIREFNYVLLPNDHTSGRLAGAPTPRSMIADNDEAVGFLVDAISHSDWWPSTVIFVIEDDPQVGGDHVDAHRSPLHVISPWVKRGHVSSVHVNESSIFRTMQLIFGIAEPQNAYWENAAPLYDLFTSTPDFTPYEHIPRRYPVELNPDDRSDMAVRSAMWDFSLPDSQPGLSQLLWEHLRGTEPPWPLPLPFDGDDDD